GHEVLAPRADEIALRVEFADGIARGRSVVDEDSPVADFAHAVRIAEFLAFGKFRPVVDHFISMLIFPDDGWTRGGHCFFSGMKNPRPDCGSDSGSEARAHKSATGNF